LLETGSTPLIRNTAAQQLGDVQKQHPDELFNLLTRVLPFLRSKTWETRSAAAKAIGGIVENAARFDPNGLDVSQAEATDGNSLLQPPRETELLQLDSLDITAILTYGKKLLGSAGKEHDYAINALEPGERLAHQKKTLYGRLGLEGEYFEEEPTAERSDSFSWDNASRPPKVNTAVGSVFTDDNTQSPSPFTAVSRQGSFAQTPTDESGLSKRQLNQLKRKNKLNAKNQANKVRVVDLSIRRPSVESPSGPMGTEPFPVKQNVKSEFDNDKQSNLFSLERAETDDDSKVVSDFK
ncbi:MAG: hypothetical protein Q9214_007940, partial [Letrouitia sp. 1 TL-2023]